MDMQSFGRYAALFAAVQTMAAEPKSSLRPLVFERLLEQGLATALARGLTDGELADLEKGIDSAAPQMRKAFLIGIDPTIEPELRAKGLLPGMG